MMTFNFSKVNWKKTEGPVQPYKPTRCLTLSLRSLEQSKNSQKSESDSLPLTTLAEKQASVKCTQGETFCSSTYELENLRHLLSNEKN